MQKKTNCLHTGGMCSNTIKLWHGVEKNPTYSVKGFYCCCLLGEILFLIFKMKNVEQRSL